LGKKNHNRHIGHSRLPPSIPPIGGKEETSGREDTSSKEESPSIYGTIPRMKAPRFGGLGGKRMWFAPLGPPNWGEGRNRRQGRYNRKGRIPQHLWYNDKYKSPPIRGVGGQKKLGVKFNHNRHIEHIRFFFLCFLCAYVVNNFS